MNFKKLFEDIKPHGLAILIFFIVGYIYFIKTFNGYMHNEEDVTQGLLKTTEIQKYTDEDGTFPGWTNSIFSGMPSILIKGQTSGNYIKSYNYLTPFNNQAYPFKILFLSFIGFYLLMNAFKVKPLFGAMAALAYGFATYSLSSIEAAHYTKVLAMALLPAIIGSLHLLFSGHYLKGGVTLAFNMALQVYFFHYQITFYTIICLLVMGIYYVIVLVKEKNIKQLLIATLISIFAIGSGVLTNITKIKTTSDFAKNTMRGGNDMAKVDNNVNQKESGKDGLNRDYAFSWSYGKAETFTLLIPNFYGGSSREKLSTSSAFYKETGNDEAIEQGLPMYHGDLQFTSGPIYIGAIIIFLFVLGMFVVKSPIKWALFALTLISFILGWGKHFSSINYWLFDNLPYYNKFRTPMMAFSIAQVTIPLIGFLGLKEIYDNWKDNKKGVSFNFNILELFKSAQTQYWDKILLSFFITAGFCILAALLGPMIMDMGGAVDEELRQSNANLISVLKEDRISLLRKDAFRSLIFIAIAFGLLYAWFNKQVKGYLAIILIGAFATIDLIGVDWRYLNWDDFVFEKGTATDRIPDMADKQVMSDQDPHFRVFDLTRDPFNNNEGAAFHKMIGGYDPAKLSRFQDLISEFLSQKPLQDKGLDMLNCKYMIGSDGQQRMAIKRGTENGNAWFVNQLIETPNAKKEMDTLKAINNKTIATFNSSFENNQTLKAQTLTVDSNATAKLLSYHPDTMYYKTNNLQAGYLVFSEIYYDNWQAEIDGKPMQLNKVNYTLRGLAVPAGNHQIKLYFNKGDNTTDNIEKGVSLTILILMLVMSIIWLKSYFTKSKTT
ncbi:MAG: YfhO family protein [Bacteroidota bacterium]|nr:YfhO family protein [Bacteroidota bacterium]